MCPTCPIAWFSLATISQGVRVRPIVDGAFLYQALLDEFVKVWIQSPVVDLAPVIFVERLLDGEAFGTTQPGNHVQAVALETAEIVHRS